MRLPLEGLRVIEIGELVAGPFAGTLLAEFGAEVVKVERPGRGDLLRQFGPSVNGKSLYWLVNSRGKKSVVLDLRLPRGREVLAELIACSDVLVESLRPGTFEGWGFDEMALRKQNPRLVIVYASAFGRRGPYRAKGGYDPIAQGFSGLSYVTGSPDGPPMRAGGAIPICDFMTGVLGALGALLALYERDARGSGLGQAVDAALYDVAFRMLGPLLTLHDLTGEVWERQGNHSLGGAPTGHFRTGEGEWICMSVQSDDQFARCARLLGHPAWIDDPRFKTLNSRTRHRDMIEATVADWVGARQRDVVLRAFEEAGLVAGPIYSIADIAKDEHMAARGIEWHDEPELGRVRVPAVVPMLSRTPGTARRSAPAVGADTADVLSGLLGYSEERIRALMTYGVIPSPASGQVEGRRARSRPGRGAT